MPRHLKKTAANPTSGMPQTWQLAASGGVCISKGALIATQHLERRHQVDDFIRRHNSTGVVWDIDVESRVHLFIRVIRGRVFYHCDLVAKLSGITNSCLHTRMCDEPYDDEVMDTVFLELQIQIGVGEAAGTPMFEGDDIAPPR